MPSICFRIGLDLHGLILVLSFEIFFSTFVKMAYFQGNKDSSDIFLYDYNCPLIKSSIFHDTVFTFFQFMIFDLRTFNFDLMKFFFRLSLNLYIYCAHDSDLKLAQLITPVL